MAITRDSNGKNRDASATKNASKQTRSNTNTRNHAANNGFSMTYSGSTKKNATMTESKTKKTK